MCYKFIVKCISVCMSACARTIRGSLFNRQEQRRTFQAKVSTFLKKAAINKTQTNKNQVIYQQNQQHDFYLCKFRPNRSIIVCFCETMTIRTKREPLKNEIVVHVQHDEELINNKIRMKSKPFLTKNTPARVCKPPSISLYTRDRLEMSQ